MTISASSAGCPEFCAGAILHSFAIYKGGKELSPSANLLRLFEYAGGNGMIFMGDCEEGLADVRLFAPLLRENGNNVTIPHPQGLLHYSISDYYYNKNSRNMCRHLTAWLELSDDAIEKHRRGEDDDEGDEEEYDDY